ncbi:hypothetical protein TNCV_1654971 [Trichonephila clavipes]|nr:hypothetical protein TNCV_1654971 [Trichonephila clavipes]
MRTCLRDEGVITPSIPISETPISIDRNVFINRIRRDGYSMTQNSTKYAGWGWRKKIEKSYQRLYLGSPKSFKAWKMLIYVVKSSSRSFCRAWDRVIIGRDDSDRLVKNLSELLQQKPRWEMHITKFSKVTSIHLNLHMKQSLTESGCRDNESRTQVLSSPDATKDMPCYGVDGCYLSSFSPHVGVV